jgi:inorganic triphosphatase YgiF
MLHRRVPPITMAREVELKLEIEPGKAGRLTANRQLLSQLRVERQISVYYDTPKGKLRRHGMVLRVRQHDGGWVQTIKRVEAGAGLFDRDEWESPVQSLLPDLQAIADTPLKDLIKPRQFCHLIPVFRTDVERTSWQLRDGDGAIELTYDEGQIEAGPASEPVHELELELRDGEIGELFAAAKKICRRIPAKLGVQAKSERGFALADGRAKAPVKATRVELNRDVSVADGFAAIVVACIRHFRLNEPLLVAERNAEALHQVRVSIRRLRTALWLFKPVVKGEEFGRIDDQLRIFTRELGAARNIDVILASMAADDPARSQLEKDRGHLYGKILRKLGTARFHVFILDLIAWVRVGDWRSGKRAAKPLLPFALKRLDLLWSRIDERGSELTHLSETDRHHLRIDAKKIRYALEFLSEPLGPDCKAQSKFIKKAEGVQEWLGRLNDLATREKLLAIWHPEDAKNAVRYLRSAKRCMGDLERIGPFWQEAV